MKEFEFYLKSQLVKKQSPDINTATATARESTERLNMAKSIISTQKPKYALENAYEALREYIDAILYSKGYKSYSHEASIAYLLKLGFSITQADMADKLRKQRNAIKYYGGDATEEEAIYALKTAEDIINELKKKSKLPTEN